MTALEFVQAEIAKLQKELEAKSKAFRAPPPIPTICCGRGCNGCVWDGYYNAASWWVEEVNSTFDL